MFNLQLIEHVCVDYEFKYHEIGMQVWTSCQHECFFEIIRSLGEIASWISNSNKNFVAIVSWKTWIFETLTEKMDFASAQLQRAEGRSKWREVGEAAYEQIRGRRPFCSTHPHTHITHTSHPLNTHNTHTCFARVLRGRDTGWILVVARSLFNITTHHFSIHSLFSLA